MEGQLNDEDIDTHLCLVCQQTIMGLMNYVSHKKSGCLRKTPSSRPEQHQSHTHQGTFTTESQLFEQSYPHEATSSHPQPPSILPSTSHDSGYNLSGQDSFVLSSFSHFGGEGSTYPDHHPQNAHKTGAQSGGGLDVDVASRLSSFIDSAFSPNVNSSVDPNTVLQGAGGSSQSSPDFFLSLELERKGGEKSLESAACKTMKSKRKGLPEEFEFDLPITMILSTLEFSSDEEETGAVPFSSDGFDLDGSDSEWIELPPPRSHTKGKWKPGQAPKSYHPHRPNGGKWKPGQNPMGRKRTSRQPKKCTRGFYCNTCKTTFLDRSSYSYHLSYEHKEDKEKEKDGTQGKQDCDSPRLLLPSVILDDTTGEMVVVKAQNPKPESVSPACIVKRGQGNVTFCETCDLYFDTVKMYEIHCETKQHKEALSRKTKEIHEIMLGSPPVMQDADNEVPSYSAGQDNSSTSISPAEESEKKPTPTIHLCEVCEKTFARKYEMARHLLTNFHRQRAIKHPKALEMLNRYNKYVIRLCPYQCTVCQFYFNRSLDLLDHLHSEGHVVNCEDLVGPLMCVPCKYKTATPADILEHVQSPEHQRSVVQNHNVCIIRECHSKIVCKYCGVQMHSAVRMKRHIEVRHKDRKVRDTVEIRTQTKAPVPCPQCGKVFPGRYEVTQHYQAKHVKIKPYKCDTCNKEFSEARTLAYHKETPMHLRRAHEHQLAQEYVAKKGEQEESEVTAKDLVYTVVETKEQKEKRKHRKRKADASTMQSPVTGRPKRSIQRPKRYFESETCDNINTNSDNGQVDEKMNTNVSESNQKDSDSLNVNNDEESESKATETVLQLEQTSNPGNTNAAEDSLPQIHGVDIDPLKNITSDTALEEVLGTIDSASTDRQEDQVEGKTTRSKFKKEMDSVCNSAKSVDEDYILENAPISFDSEINLQHVRSTVKKLSLFSCKYCDFTAGDNGELKDHAEEKHPNDVVRCTPCSQIFLTEKAYKVHCAGSFHQGQLNKCNLKEEMFVCSYCDKKHTDERSHKLHIEFAHMHISTEEAMAHVVQGRDSVTLLYGDELKQLEKVHCKTTVACPECGSFLLKHNLIEHLRSHTGERPFKCRHCSKCFSSPNSLRRHLIDHIGMNPVNCQECGETFRKPGAYTTHMRIHANKNQGIRYDCNVCKATFYLEKMLVNHMKRHGDRKYSCPVEGCHWKFVLKVELREHMFTHTREKKFLCDICGFETGTKTRMRRHAKTHQPIKELPCEYCPYKSTCKIHLKRHMRIHIGNKPYKCLYCDYACNTAENIRKHILQTRKHKGEKLYPCKFCDFKCNAGKEFRQHLLQCHIEYIKVNASASLMHFTGLYRAEEDLTKPPEGSEIHQVMKGRFVKIYDGTRVGSTGEAVRPPKKKSRSSKSKACQKQTSETNVGQKQCAPEVTVEPSAQEVEVVSSPIFREAPILREALMKVNGSPILRVDGSPIVKVNGSPIVRVDGSPVVKMDGSPVVKVDGSPIVKVDGSPSPIVKVDGSPMVKVDETAVVKVDEEAVVSIVTNQPPDQPESATTVQTMEVAYPCGLPWTVVTPQNQSNATWIPQGLVTIKSVVDMMVPQTTILPTTQVGPATFVGNPTVVSSIPTTINIEGISYHQLEPGTYQVIASANPEGEVSTVSVVDQQ